VTEPRSEGSWVPQAGRNVEHPIFLTRSHGGPTLLKFPTLEGPEAHRELGSSDLDVQERQTGSVKFPLELANRHSEATFLIDEREQLVLDRHRHRIVWAPTGFLQWGPIVHLKHHQQRSVELIPMVGSDPFQRATRLLKVIKVALLLAYLEIEIFDPSIDLHTGGLRRVESDPIIERKL
jgi:hypothetical protein